MKVIYIRETKETCDFIKKIILRIKCLFNIINIEKIDERIIYNLPIYANKNISKYRIKKVSKKVIKILEENGVSNVVISKYLGTLETLKNYLYSENINILDGRYLFKCLSSEVIEYILKRKNKQMKESEIYLLVNDFNNINKEIIVNIAKNVKTLNIITNNVNKFKNIEKYLYNEYGILLNISNNKRNSILNAKVILNFDFPEEILNQYNIYNKAIIVNLLEKISIQCKKFNGININYFKIDIPKEIRLEGFKDEEVYERCNMQKKFT